MQKAFATCLSVYLLRS